MRPVYIEDSVIYSFHVVRRRSVKKTYKINYQIPNGNKVIKENQFLIKRF